MIYRSHRESAFFHDLTVLACYLEVGMDETGRRDPSKTDDDLRADELHLLSEVPDTRIRFLGEGVTVVRRAAFEDICDINVLAGDPDRGEIFVEELTCSTDKRYTGRILSLTGSLTYEHELCVFASATEHEVRSSLP